MTQGKVCVMNKPTNGTQDGASPTAPPTYEEATTGGSSPCYSGGYYCEGYPGDGEMLTQWGWHNQNIRRIFIRKVYAILTTQLLITLAIVALFAFCNPVKIYIQANPGWYRASYAAFFVTYLTLCCCAGPRRRYPWNLILLAVFTVSMAFMTAFMSSFYDTKSVMICLGITAMVCLSVTTFSFQTKTDITSCQGVLFVLCMATLFSGIMLCVVLPFGYVPWLHAIYAAAGAVLFTMLLAFDTQLLMGSRCYAISPEEYVFATLNIYLDIIYLFSFLLQMSGSND